MVLGEVSVLYLDFRYSDERSSVNALCADLLFISETAGGHVRPLIEPFPCDEGASSIVDRRHAHNAQARATCASAGALLHV